MAKPTKKARARKSKIMFDEEEEEVDALPEAKTRPSVTNTRPKAETAAPTTSTKPKTQIKNTGLFDDDEQESDPFANL